MGIFSGTFCIILQNCEMNSNNEVQLHPLLVTYIIGATMLKIKNLPPFAKLVATHQHHQSFGRKALRDRLYVFIPKLITPKHQKQAITTNQFFQEKKTNFINRKKNQITEMAWK